MHGLGPIGVPNFKAFLDAQEPTDSKEEQLLLDIGKELEVQIQKFSELQTRSSHVAWLHLFTRNWNVVQTALMLGPGIVPQIGEVLRRLEFELILDLQLIQGSLAAMRFVDPTRKPEFSPSELQSRLSAYVVYCILQDLDYYRRIRQTKYLDELYDHKIDGQFAANPALRYVLEQFWGPDFKTPDAAEIKNTRKRVQSHAHEMVNMLLDLLDSDSDLSYWNDVANRLRANGQYSFAELLDPDLRSISKLANEMLGPVHAVEYQWTSAAIHGKSLENVLFCEDIAVIPYWSFGNNQKSGNCLEGIGRIAHMNTVRLTILADDVLAC